MPFLRSSRSSTSASRSQKDQPRKDSKQIVQNTEPANMNYKNGAPAGNPSHAYPNQATISLQAPASCGVDVDYGRCELYNPNIGMGPRRTSYVGICGGGSFYGPSCNPPMMCNVSSYGRVGSVRGIGSGFGSMGPGMMGSMYGGGGFGSMGPGMMGSMYGRGFGSMGPGIMGSMYGRGFGSMGPGMMGSMYGGGGFGSMGPGMMGSMYGGGGFGSMGPAMMGSMYGGGGFGSMGPGMMGSMYGGCGMCGNTNYEKIVPIDACRSSFLYGNDLIRADDVQANKPNDKGASNNENQRDEKSLHSSEGNTDSSRTQTVRASPNPEVKKIEAPARPGVKSTTPSPKPEMTKPEMSKPEVKKVETPSRPPEVKKMEAPARAEMTKPEVKKVEAPSRPPEVKKMEAPARAEMTKPEMKKVETPSKPPEVKKMEAPARAEMTKPEVKKVETPSKPPEATKMEAPGKPEVKEETQGSKNANGTGPTNPNIRGLVVIVPDETSKSSDKKVLSKDRSTVTVGGRDTQVDEVQLMKPSAYEEGGITHECRSMWLLGHNTTVLLACSNGQFKSCVDFAKGFLASCINKLIALKDPFKIYATMVAFKDGKSIKDLLDDKKNSYEALQETSSPIYGPAIGKTQIMEINDVADSVKAIEKCIKAATDPKELICCFFVLKQAKKINDKTVCYLSSLNISFSGECGQHYVDIKDKKSTVPYNLYRYSIGGGSTSVCIACVGEKDESATKVIDACSKLREVKNSPPRSGNVARFVEFTQGEVLKCKEKIDKADNDSTKKTCKSILERMERMLKDAEALLADPIKTKPLAY